MFTGKTSCVVGDKGQAQNTVDNWQRHLLIMEGVSLQRASIPVVICRRPHPLATLSPCSTRQTRNKATLPPPTQGSSFMGSNICVNT